MSKPEVVSVLTLLLICVDAGVLALGCLALLGGTWLGLQGLSLPATGRGAILPGIVCTAIGVPLAVVTFFGLRYSWPHIRRGDPRDPPPEEVRSVLKKMSHNLTRRKTPEYSDKDEPS